MFSEGTLSYTANYVWKKYTAKIQLPAPKTLQLKKSHLKFQSISEIILLMRNHESIF